MKELAGKRGRVMGVGDARYAFAVVCEGAGGGEDGEGGACVGGGGGGGGDGRGLKIGAGRWWGRMWRWATIGDCRGGGDSARGETGDRVVVQAGAVLGATGFGYARNAETGEYLMFPQQGRW